MQNGVVEGEANFELMAGAGRPDAGADGGGAAVEGNALPDSDERRAGVGCAAPEAVLAALTDPDAVARWSPVAFDIEDDAYGRLRTGTRTRVSGRLAGVRVGFDYDVIATDDGSTSVSASISLAKGRGFMAGLLAEATAGLLRAGALSHAVNRIAATA